MRNMKTLALLLLAFAFVFVTACSGKTSAPPEETPPVVEDNNNNEQPDEQPDEPEEPAFDMNGETITILTWIKADIPTDETATGTARLERQKEVEEKYNVKIKWELVPWAEPFNMVSKAGLSGDPAADITLQDYYYAVPLINQGLLRPVDDLFDFDDPKWPKGMKEAGLINGKQYGFRDNIVAGAGIYFNKTLFQREGLEDPHELLAKGEWTWEKMLEIAQKATKDTDGDGTIDQWGFVNHAGILARLLMNSNDGKLMDYVDGKHIFNIQDPKNMEALHFLYDMFNTHKVIMPNTGSGDHPEAAKTFAAGKAAMVTGELWEGHEYVVTMGMTDDLGYIRLPKGPSAASNDVRMSIENFTMYYIPANAKYPEETAVIWQEMILWDEMEDIWRTEVEQAGLADEIDNEEMLKANTLSYPTMTPGGTGYGDAVWSMVLNGETPESAVEKIAESGQQAVDDYYGQ